jgi:hypothetical protein
VKRPWNSDITEPRKGSKKASIQDLRLFTAVAMKNAVLWDVAPCRYCINRRFGGTYRLHVQSRKKSTSEEPAWAPHPRRWHSAKWLLDCIIHGLDCLYETVTGKITEVKTHSVWNREREKERERDVRIIHR